MVMYARRYRGSRSGSRYRVRRNVARQHGYRTFSSRVAGGFVQPRVTRAPRVERCRFLDLNWTDGIGTGPDHNYYQASQMVCHPGDNAMDVNSQLTNNKRCLNLVVNGSGNNDRTSARIMMTSLLLRGTLYYSPITNGSNYVPMGRNIPNYDGSNSIIGTGDVDRSITIFVVYYPRVALTGYPGWNTLLEVPITTNSLLDETNPYGARVLMRRSFRLSLDVVGGVPTLPDYSIGRNSRRDFAWKLNLGLPAEWLNNIVTGPNLGAMRSGQLMIYTISNANATTLSGTDFNVARCPKVSLRARLAFVDA